jgi:hypothetical protein
MTVRDGVQTLALVVVGLDVGIDLETVTLFMVRPEGRDR